MGIQSAGSFESLPSALISPKPFTKLYTMLGRSVCYRCDIAFRVKSSRIVIGTLVMLLAEAVCSYFVTAEKRSRSGSANKHNSI